VFCCGFWCLFRPFFFCPLLPKEPLSKKEKKEKKERKKERKKEERRKESTDEQG
jgi:hypothetical protein